MLYRPLVKKLSDATRGEASWAEAVERDKKLTPASLPLYGGSDNTVEAMFT